MISASLGEEIANYINKLCGKKTSVFDLSGRVIFAQDADTSKIKLPVFIKELTSAKKIEINSIEHYLLPLKFENKNIALLLIENDSEEIATYLPLIISFSELLISQSTEKSGPILDQTDKFIAKILSGYSENDKESYLADANLLGYRLDQKRIGIIIHLGKFWENCLLDLNQASFERDQLISHWKRNIEDKFNSYFTKNADLMTAYIGKDRFIIYKTIDNSVHEEKTKNLIKKAYKSIFGSLKNHRIETVTVGYGNAYSGVDGLIAAKKEAELALEMGEKIWGENQSYYFGELGLFSIIGEGDRTKKINFANQVLCNLKNNELPKTLEYFFDNNLNLTETADAMGIHRNTVIYRLNQIAKMLKADPRVFEQAMSIKIALLIKKLFD